MPCMPCVDPCPSVLVEILGMSWTMATVDIRRLEVLREALRSARILSRATRPGGLVAVTLLLSAQAFTGLAWAVSDSTETLQRDPLQRERRR